MFGTTNFWDSYVRYLGRMRERKMERETERLVSQLPRHLRRDIGWPGAYERIRNHHQH